ncbi:MAG: methyltransferase domain-containing protein [PS1 clade bacterium]|uniref:Methyltransferase domain-containing protein n=1 Tax=PS1 clade bacterium TaxID=2175152 RepID=A0A368E4B2_9PROT|nr:MAG: methyltransferase domain-containing protein [PS1 clade bacterium]HAK98928.1 ArsR family transcriptional regulator [Rhodobiaceae bacterium]|tara:strand:- start:4947 stop:5948 length:1002 start_codon:yes stop_codon:yes gene_type:complete
MENLLAALKAAGEETRLRLLAVLNYGELTVTELTHILGQSQPRVSRHLKLLTEAGLVMRYPEGSWVFYRLSDQGHSAEIVSAVVSMLPGNDLILQRDYDRFLQVQSNRSEKAQDYFSSNAENWETLRNLHIADSKIESKMLEMLGNRKINEFVDFGTGAGRMLELFGPRANKAVGFDLNAEMLALARTRLEELSLSNCQVRLGDVALLPLKSASADLIVIHQLLHFLDDPAAAISEASRILSPNGLLLVVDFAPHEMETLREHHAHRRLGFSKDEILKVFNDVDITSHDYVHLDRRGTKSSPSESLRVTIWSGIKSNVSVLNPGKQNSLQNKQ